MPRGKSNQVAGSNDVRYAFFQCGHCGLECLKESADARKCENFIKMKMRLHFKQNPKCKENCDKNGHKVLNYDDQNQADNQIRLDNSARNTLQLRAFYNRNEHLIPTDIEYQTAEEVLGNRQA